MTHPISHWRFTLLLLASSLTGTIAAADEPTVTTPDATIAPAPSKHQLMKDCMAKQKLADSGKPKYELSEDCRNIIKTEKENADTVKKDVDAKPATDKPTPR